MWEDLSVLKRRGTGTEAIPTLRRAIRVIRGRSLQIQTRRR